MATCYKDFAEKYPKAFAVRRIPLDFLSGAAFEQQADSFLRDGLRKGIPSLFSTLRPLYKKALGRRELTETYFTKGLTVSDSSQSGCQARVATVGKLVEGYLKSLRETSKLPGCNEEEAPTVFLWVLYFLAQHRDMLGDQDGALKLIDEALKHSPTLVDLYHVSQAEAPVLPSDVLASTQEVMFEKFLFYTFRATHHGGLHEISIFS